MRLNAKVLGTISGVALVALMYWVIAYQNAALRLSVVELLLLIIGGIGVALLVATYTFSRDLANFSRGELPPPLSDVPRTTNFRRDHDE